MLIEGAIGGAVLSLLAFLLSKFINEVVGRTLLATVLFAAAAAYFRLPPVPALIPQPAAESRVVHDDRLRSFRTGRNETNLDADLF